MSKASVTRDLVRLAAIADELARLESLYAERERIWQRHIERGDCTQAELAAASRVKRSAVGRLAIEVRAKALVTTEN